MAIDDRVLNEWFCQEVLPLERGLTRYILRNSRNNSDLSDLRQAIYERVLAGARRELPQNTKAFVFTVARNHLINFAKRAQIISFELVSDLETVESDPEIFDVERHLSARDELRRAHEGLDRLPPRCREVVRLRKVEGLSTKEVAERMGVGIHTVEKQMTDGMRALVDFMMGGSGKVRRRRDMRAEIRGKSR